MTAQRLYLMRHGEAEKGTGQEAGQLFSTGDHPLSTRGRRQAQQAARWLAEVPVDAVYASPAVRCRETAESLAAPLGLEVTTDERLWELPFAEPGTDYEDVLARIVQLARDLESHGQATLAAGGTYEEETTRFREAIQDLLAEHEAPLVVAHGAQNRAYLAHLLGMPAHHLFRIEQDHGCMNVIAFQGSRRVVEKLNVTEPALRSEASSWGSE